MHPRMLKLVRAAWAKRNTSLGRAKTSETWAMRKFFRDHDSIACSQRLRDLRSRRLTANRIFRKEIVEILRARLITKWIGTDCVMFGTRTRESMMVDWIILGRIPEDERGDFARAVKHSQDKLAKANSDAARERVLLRMLETSDTTRQAAEYEYARLAAIVAEKAAQLEGKPKIGLVHLNTNDRIIVTELNAIRRDMYKQRRIAVNQRKKGDNIMARLQAHRAQMVLP